MEEVWECLIVGAGVVGSWAGYHLAEQNKKVLILEQFMLPHTRGSSAGNSRLIRSAYDTAHHTAMMPESYRRWSDMEKASNTELIKQTGILITQDKHATGMLEKTASSMSQNRLPYALLTPEELGRKYSHFGFDGNHRGLLDESAGLIYSSRSLRVLQEEFRKKGGVIHDGEQLKHIEPGAVLKIVTSKRNYLAKKVVLATGPWSKHILEQLGVDVPLNTMPGCHVFFKVKPSHEKYYSAGNCPILYTFLRQGSQAYQFLAVFPSSENPGMIKCITRGEPPPYYCHPDDRDLRGNEQMLRTVTEFVKKNLSGVDPTPCIMEPCVYTMTPDREYIIDKHPKYSNIVIATGFSGHGFMRAPVIGRIIAGLVTGEDVGHSNQTMKLSRFSSVSKL